VLYNLTQEKLSKVLFPLGDYEKSEIREFAQNWGFINAQRPDSQDICFVPDGDYASFIEKKDGFVSIAGDYLDVNGNIIGKHKGVINYTLGQRKGLGIALGKPAFVKALDAQNNRVVLSFAEDFISATFRVKDINCMAVPTVNVGDRFDVKVRYRAVAVKCTVADITDGVFTVSFDTAQKPPATGQSAVFYIDDLVPFGGIIC